MTEVGIIGGGPTGLSAAISLARLGIASTVFERADGEDAHPKARGIRVRTMEIFRQWGLEPELRRWSLPADTLRFIYCDSLAGKEIARSPVLEWNADEVTPTSSCRTSQDVVQRTLSDRVRREPLIELRTGTTASVIDQSESRVAVGTQAGVEHFDYVIAADGAGSQVRRDLEIPQTGADGIAWWQSVYFAADLRPWTSGRLCIQFITGADRPDPVQLASVDGERRWVLLRPLSPGASARPEPLTSGEFNSLLERAVGTSMNAELLDSTVFRISALNAERYRAGRVLLAGDAAHVLPPTGGMGLNSGVQDVHNLTWKIAFVVHGWAGSELLESYELERRATADANLKWSLANAERFRALRVAMSNDDKARVSELLEEQRGHVMALGQDLGFAYEHGCLIPDGTALQPHDPAEYRPVARPGHRAPAARLGNGGSTIDLFDQQFTLIVGAGAAQLEPVAGVQVARIGADPMVADDVDLHDVYGIGSAGAVLVRPDGHVAWRSYDSSVEAWDVLRALGMRLF